MEKLGLVVFLFNRPKHARRLLETISTNDLTKISNVFIYVDGPRNDSDKLLVNEVVNAVNEFQNIFQSTNLTLYKHETNLGLKKSVRSGVNKALTIVDEVIVLEDDLILSPFFIDWVVTRLPMLRTGEVFSLSGYSYPSIYDGIDGDIISNRPSSWGWVINKSSWDAIGRFTNLLNTHNSSYHLRLLLNRKIPIDLRMMLLAEFRRRINSWAVYYAYYHFRFNKKCLMHSPSLVVNNGFDDSGTHCESTDIWTVEIARTPPKNQFSLPERTLDTDELFKKSSLDKFKFFIKIILWLSIQLVNRHSMRQS